MVLIETSVEYDLGAANLMEMLATLRTALQMAHYLAADPECKPIADCLLACIREAIEESGIGVAAARTNDAIVSYEALK